VIIQISHLTKPYCLKYNSHIVKENTFTERAAGRMKSSLLDLAYLFDFYADLLTDKQRDYLDLYYHQDLSLSEIAENEGITRQGVRDVIARGEGLLHHMEEKLGLVARYGRVSADMEQVVALADQIITLSRQSYMGPDIRELAECVRETALPLTAPQTRNG
jgi:predicted DNA-binding protein YlxM (UPF0122 family)